MGVAVDRCKGRPHPKRDFRRKSRFDLSRCAFTDRSANAGEAPGKARLEDSPWAFAAEITIAPKTTPGLDAETGRWYTLATDYLFG